MFAAALTKGKMVILDSQFPEVKLVTGTESPEALS